MCSIRLFVKLVGVDIMKGKRERLQNKLQLSQLANGGYSTSKISQLTQQFSSTFIKLPHTTAALHTLLHRVFLVEKGNCVKSQLILLYITSTLHGPGQWKHFQSGAVDTLFLEWTKPHIPNLEPGYSFHSEEAIKA